MKKKIYLAFGLLFWIGAIHSANAQQKIGSNPGTLNSGAVLELESSNRGFLLPRVSLPTSLTTFGLNGTATPATNGMMVYNTNASTPGGVGYYVWSGTTGTEGAPVGGAWSRIFTGSLPGSTNSLTYNAGTLTSTVNGVASSATIPTANSTTLGLLSAADWNTFNTKQNALTVSNGLTLTGSALTLGGALTGATSLTLGANSFTFGGATTGKVIVSGPAGSSTSGLQLSNLLTAVTPSAASAGQRILTVDGSGNVILGTDFGTNNAGTVTSVSGSAPISVATGTTTPVISINPLGITSGLLADGAVTPAKIAPGTNGQYLTTAGGVTTWASLPDADVTGAANGLSLVSGNVELGGTLTKATSVTLGTNALTFNASGSGQFIVSGPTGNTSGLRLSNLTGAGTAGTSGQKVLSVNASGDVVLVTDFGTNNAGTVTNVTGTSPITVSNGSTTPVIGINQAALDLASIGGTLPVNKLVAGTAGQTLQIVGTTPTWVTPAASNTPNIYTADGSLTGNRTVSVGANKLNFTFSGTPGQLVFDNGDRGSNPRIAAGSDTLEIQTQSNANQIALLPNGRVSIGSFGPAVAPNPTSNLHVNGSISYGIRRITAARTLDASDRTILANAFTAGFAITLPAPNTCAGREYIIRKVDESSNAITFTFTGITGSNAIRVSDTSASAGSYINSLNYVKTLRIQSDGTDWYLID